MINRDLHKVLFHRIETLPDVHAIKPGLELVTWSTAKHAIASKQTTPLPVIVTLDEWSRLHRASFAADSWLTDEREATDEFCWDWPLASL